MDPGNIVHATDTNPMFVITQLQPIAVLFTLPEDNLPAVRGKRPGHVEVDAYSRDDQTKLATGKLLTIDNQIDQTPAQPIKSGLRQPGQRAVAQSIRKYPLAAGRPQK